MNFYIVFFYEICITYGFRSAMIDYARNENNIVSPTPPIAISYNVGVHVEKKCDNNSNNNEKQNNYGLNLGNNEHNNCGFSNKNTNFFKPINKNSVVNTTSSITNHGNSSLNSNNFDNYHFKKKKNMHTE